MFHRIAPAGALFIASTLAMPACGEEEVEPGSVSTSWEIVPRGCADSSITTVRVSLLKGDAAQYTNEYPCGSQSGTIESVAPGKYKVVAEGLDAGGVARYRSDEEATVTALEGSEVTASRLDLIGIPAKVQAEWTFSNGKFCTPNMVETIRVQVFDVASNPIADEEFPCGDQLGVIEGLPAGSGYVVRVSSAGVGSWSAQAGDKDEDMDMVIDDPIDLKFGDIATVSLELTEG